MRGSTHSKTRRCDLSGNNFRCTTDVRDNSASCTTCSSLCTSKREEGGGTRKGEKHAHATQHQMSMRAAADARIRNKQESGSVGSGVCDWMTPVTQHMDSLAHLSWSARSNSGSTNSSSAVVVIKGATACGNVQHVQ